MADNDTRFAILETLLLQQAKRIEQLEQRSAIAVTAVCEQCGKPDDFRERAYALVEAELRAMRVAQLDDGGNYIWSPTETADAVVSGSLLQAVEVFQRVREKFEEEAQLFAPAPRRSPRPKR